MEYVQDDLIEEIDHRFGEEIGEVKSPVKAPRKSASHSNPAIHLSNNTILI